VFDQRRGSAFRQEITWVDILNFRLVLRILGWLLLVSGAVMFLPLIFSFHFQDGAQQGILLSIAVNLAVGLGLVVTTRGDVGEPGAREGFAIVTLGWLVLATFGSLPFVFCIEMSPVDAFFETMSGYTTTGASVLTDIEAVPEGVLFWRALTHWLGGMGVLLLAIAILPLLGVGGMQLFRAEVPGPVKDRLTPRITSTAQLLWVLYLVLTLVETMLLMVHGMSLYEALCHSFATMATGGFSTRTASVAAFDSAYVETVIIVFMFLAGTSFALQYRVIYGCFGPGKEWKGFWKDEEFRFYLLLIVGAIFLVAMNLQLQGDYTPRGGLRTASFQVVSIITTTGFCTDNFDAWPSFSKFILLFLMFVGGCAGSTGGGMKVVRVLILMKHGWREIKRLIFPGAVLPLKVGGKAVPDDVVTNVLGFFLLFMLVFVVATLAVAAHGVDFTTSFTSVVATLANIGPGFARVGAVENYGHLPATVKLILTFCMLLGRLEIFTVLVLFVPKFWKK
jgi:trk system potassium uptake protein TrkH